MKFTFAIIFFISAVGLYGAARGPRVLGQDPAITGAVALAQAGKVEEMVSYLRANIRPEQGPDGALAGLLQGMIRVSTDLYNQRRLRLAREVGEQALAESLPLFKNQTKIPLSRQVDLVASLGSICEYTLFDLERAKVLYDFAAAIDPAHKEVAARCKRVSEKLQLRKTR